MERHAVLYTLAFFSAVLTLLGFATGDSTNDTVVATLLAFVTVLFLVYGYAMHKENKVLIRAVLIGLVLCALELAILLIAAY
jgi:hypothetical protein